MSVSGSIRIYDFSVEQIEDILTVDSVVTVFGVKGD
jgi:hypothetical protein